MTERSDNVELEQAVADLRAAAAGFDERLTEMVTVQRRLIRALKLIDADLLHELGPQTATELVVELRDLTQQLQGHAHQPDAPASAPAAAARGRSARAVPDDLEQALPQVLADQPVDVRVLRACLHGSDGWKGFPLLADMFEQLEREQRLGEQPLGRERVAGVLCELRGIGEQRADRILEEAELPPDVTVGDLGPGDIDRLAETMRRYRGGFPRDEQRTPRPDPLRGQNPQTATYAQAGAEVGQAFTGAFSRDAPELEDLFTRRTPPLKWPADGLTAGLLLLEWARTSVLGAVDETFVAARPVQDAAGAADLARHLRPVRERVHDEFRALRPDDVNDPATDLAWRRLETVDRVVAAAGLLTAASKLEQVDPLVRRQKSTPRERCCEAAREIAAAVYFAPVADEAHEQLAAALAERLAAPGDTV